MISRNHIGLPQRTSFVANKTRIPLNLGLVSHGLFVNTEKRIY